MEKTPETVHTINERLTDPVCFNTPVGETKIPEPIILPTMTVMPFNKDILALSRISPPSSSFSGGSPSVFFKSFIRVFSSAFFSLVSPMVCRSEVAAEEELCEWTEQTEQRTGVSCPHILTTSLSQCCWGGASSKEKWGCYRRTRGGHPYRLPLPIHGPILKQRGINYIISFFFFNTMDSNL